MFNIIFRYFGYYLDRTVIIDIEVEGQTKILKDINANEVTLLGDDGDTELERSDSFTHSHIKLGAEVHYTPDDDVFGKALRCKIIKVRVHRKFKSIHSKTKVVKPVYELTIRPPKIVPKKSGKSSPKK
jgi:hypothetical protein